MLSLDTETTGVDFFHGAAPYFVSMCSDTGKQYYWEWDVDPRTREPIIPFKEKQEVRKFVLTNRLVLQNAKFDLHALASVGIKFDRWNRIDDTLVAAHLLASNHPHDLTSLAIKYVGLNIQPYEEKLHKAVEEARRYARSNYPEWMIAKAGLPCMPSAKEKTWKYDGWLPRKIAQEEDLPEDHPWWTVLSEYANMDSLCTIAIFQAQMEKIKERGLEKLYWERLKLIPIIYHMEHRGITLCPKRLNEIRQEYMELLERMKARCRRIAIKHGFKLEIPKTGNNQSLLTCAFEVLKLPPVEWTEKGAPSLNKVALEKYETDDRLSPAGKEFVTALKKVRKYSTSLSYIESYERFWRPHPGGKILHPSLNQTGTDTLRMSSNHPNEQNISKLKDEHGRSIRYIFGPVKGREWWSLDYDNLELRIPAYESGEEEMIKIFDNPDDPPYFGSYHLLIFDILHPELFAKHGALVKELFKDTWYQRTKNGNFADQNGAMEESGTADRAYGVPGAQRKIAGRLTQKAALNAYWINQAEQLGYVTTLPDRTVDPERGYPLLCSRSPWGKIRPTVPLNYHVQGTACWVTARAMVKIEKKFPGLIIMNVHDELVFDLPFGRHKRNLPKIRAIKQLMESCGDDIGITLTCGVTYHPENWADGEVVHV